MNRLKNRIGMTLAEMLIVIAIIAVLAGVAFIAVWNHMRSLGQLERDGIAKEIFVAAQNHLTMAYGEDYLKASDYGTKDGDGIQYFVVNHGSGFTAGGTSVLDQMLPFGSIDETVRAGGNYIIRYQKETGLVLDVFYCSGNGSRYDYSFFEGGKDYSYVLSKKGAENKSARRTFVNGSILGWYGAAGAATLPTLKLQAPEIEVINAEKLYVKITDSNSPGASLRLIVTGVKSKISHYINVVTPKSSGHYEVVLDEVTAPDSKSILQGNTGGGHFCKRKYDDMTAAFDNGMYPGEDIVIQAVAYSNSVLANVAYSTKHTANSLFDSISADGTAYITNIRHLENLDNNVSGVDTTKINITAAVQETNLDWIQFKTRINTLDSSTSVKIFKKESGDSGTSQDCYYPVIPAARVASYDGKNHQISNIAVDYSGEAGLFGSVSTMREIKNLELIDFSITGTTGAGALAGSLTKTSSGTTISNVLARNSSGDVSKKITASAGDAGGLVGSITGVTVQYSAAALAVDGSSTAGGLVGAADSNSVITGCFSGGHTENGSYKEWVAANDYDVKGAVVGGLVGSSSASITNSYSTCSVSGTSKAGGFVGNAPSGTITHCYCTGLVSPEKNGTTVADNAFIKKEESDSVDVKKDDINKKSYYFESVNEVVTEEGGKITTVEYKGPGISNVDALDETADTYNAFVGAETGWKPASAYSAVLRSYYGGRYNLKTVEQLENGTSWDSEGSDKKDYFVRTHYGDWPAPEIFVINEAQ